MSTAIFTPLGGRIEIRLFGKPLGDFSLASEEGKKNGGAELRKLGIQKVYAPKGTNGNAEICDPLNLTEPVQLGGEVTAWRGVLADGLIIDQPNTAFWITPADCMVIVAIHPKSGMTIVTHAGRASLIDTKHIQDSSEPRNHFGVVSHMIELFTQRLGKHSISALKIFLTSCIGADYFLHPTNHKTYGEKNKRLVEYLVNNYGASTVRDQELGQISLSEVAKAQFTQQGIRPDHIGFDLVDTYSDADQNGEKLWWSHRRSLEEQDGKDACRNGILVLRRW